MKMYEVIALFFLNELNYKHDGQFCNTAQLGQHKRVSYLDLVRRRSRVRFPGHLRPCRGGSSVDRARAQGHIVGVLSPFPRVDHEVTEAWARWHQSVCFLGLDRGRLDNRNQNPFRGIVAENYPGMFRICHRVILENTQMATKNKTVMIFCGLEQNVD